MSNTTIQLRKSGQTGNTPADLAHGELAINYADGKLFYKNGVGIKSIENQKTFSTVNANNSLIIATSPTDILSLAAGSNILIDTNTVTKTVTISVPGGSSIDTVARELAQGAFTAANTAGSNTVYLQAVNDLQNTNITSVDTFAQAAFNRANTVPTQLQTVGIRTNASYFPLFVDANNATLAAESVYSTGAGITINPSSNTITATTLSGTLVSTSIATFSQYVDLTGDNDYIEWGTNDDVRMMYNGTANTINLQLYSDVISFKVVDNANTADRFIFYKANGDLRLVTGNVIFSDGTVQRTEALTSAIAAYAQANSASSNTVYLQSINDLQNTNITSVNTFAGSAFNSANAGVALATSAYAEANNASGNTVALQAVNTTQNTNITAVNTFAGSAFASANAGVTLATAAYSQANSASGNTVALQAQMTTTNTNITSVNTFTQAAYNTANLKFNTTGGTITGNVTVQNNLVVQGNLSVLGNSTTISTSSLSISDSLIFLANGNFTTDALDIGLIGHYGGPSGETHTGIFRDANLKEWIVFEGYTEQIQANNLINIANPTFAYANLYANVVKANLISTRATVNGLDVFSTMTNAWNSANAGVTLATAAYAQANNASGNTVALQAVNATQNTNITSVNTFAQAAYNEANGAVQTGFTTISANSINVTPTSNADTLTITAGNNISITACTTTRTITINSTASGGGGGGSGALTYDTAPPATGNTVGDRWVDSEDGTLYTYINDGNSSQWVDFSTAATPASVGGGTANAILYQAGVGNTTFTSVGSQGQLLTAGVAGVPIWAAQTALSIANTQITGLITNAQLAGPLGVTVTNETANSSTFYPLFSDIISGTLAIADVSSTKLTYVPSTGTLSATVVTSTSDEKLKTNISTIQNPINIIKQLRGVEYNWKDNGQKSMGVIAQEVEKILPYLVSENENSKAVMYSNMIGLLIEAIKEQQKQIDELRGKLNAD
jgi:hypothetical protein